MAIRNTRESWGWPARLLHWVMAAAILFLLGVGFYMGQVLTGEDSDTLMQKYDLVQTHKSWGFTVFVLALLRLIWRALNPSPALPDKMGRLERLAAHVGHWGLYACMIAMPLTGWLMASSSSLQDMGYVQNSVFGLFLMPDPFNPGSEELESLFKTLHFSIALALTALLLGHVAAALKHHFVNRDTVLRRMIKG